MCYSWDISRLVEVRWLGLEKHQQTKGIKQFYGQFEGIIDKVPKKDILIIQCHWNAKVGKDTYQDW
ncbi:hypothetical protein DPMN_188705 [Dreissena polymorpha]|uniref:Uncharacterized protein n=1 Tax=Dreissena polymorpha TaxID=45954 RepID=A0A9D4IBK6_DREPO|nr:hypothetical protein DPMN_188705 [Dreissena polymorpha]